jgi:hypothetical protein
MVDYDDKRICIKCGGINEIKIIDSYETYIHECETKCTACGHLDYWAYGWYSA